VTFCVYNTNSQLACAYASSGWVDMGSSEPLWDWPTGGTAQISYHGSGASGCMTRDASAGNRIDLKACQGLASQEWTAHYVSGEYGGYWFQNPASGLCLNDHWQVGQLDAASCSGAPGNDNELFSQA
jgi:hypothetical protein